MSKEELLEQAAWWESHAHNCRDDEEQERSTALWEADRLREEAEAA